MDRKKILLLTAGYPPENGGSYNYFYELLQRSSHEITVLTSQYPGTEKSDGADKQEIKRNFISTLLLVRDGRLQKLFPKYSWFWEFLSKAFDKMLIVRMAVYALIILRCLIEILSGKYDLVWCGHSCLPYGVVGPLLKIVFRKQYFCWVYGEEVTEIQRCGHPISLWLLKLTANNAENVMTVSKATSHRLKSIGVNPEIIKVSYPGVDIERFRPFYHVNRFRRRFAPNGESIVLSVGRLIDRKGFDSVIKIFPQILKRFGPVKYIIAGSGPEKKSLELITKEKNLNGSIIFLEGVTFDELPEIYNACDIFVMPNRIGKNYGDVEGFGMVFLEASSCGKPVIAGRSGGAVEAVKDRFTGFVVDPDNEEELENRIVELISNKASASQMGKNGYNRCRRQFTWEKTYRELNEIIAETA